MLVREIYENGQVVIPKHLRDMLGFKPHTMVAFTVENGRLVIEKADRFSDWADGVAQQAQMNRVLDLDELYDEELEEQTEHGSGRPRNRTRGRQDVR